MTRRITLASPSDFAGWRKAARGLLEAGIRPLDVIFDTGGDQPDLFTPISGTGMPEASAEGRNFTVPKRFLDLAETAVCHSHPERFALLYRLLWRLQRERRLLDIASDPDVMKVAAFAKAVRRDIHKMHAFVRFRTVPLPDDAESEAFVAWFEPDHHIVERAAAFFKKRFANMHWSILTPKGSVHWDRRALSFSAPRSRADAPAEDALDDWWRVYYRSIFNPARLKTGAMQAEMPRKYWRNMPEARLIPELVAAAGTRSQAMLEAEPTTPPPRHERHGRRRSGRPAKGDRST